jgi:protein-tyrosine-phosphatase
LSLRKHARAIWKDPVGSNIIAGTIIAAAGYFYLELTASASATSMLANPVIRVGIPSAAIIVVLVLWNYFRGRRKIVVFVSAGGTCRDPMAKAIAIQLLNAMKPRPRIDIRAAGLAVSSNEASYGARYVIRELYDQDLLADHEPKVLTSELIAEADLILVMDRSLLLTPGKTFPSSKTFLLKEFLGSLGDVTDPWPDGKDAATLGRYRACAQELRELLTKNMDRIVKAVEV